MCWTIDTGGGGGGTAIMGAADVNWFGCIRCCNCWWICCCGGCVCCPGGGTCIDAIETFGPFGWQFSFSVCSVGPSVCCSSCFIVPSVGSGVDFSSFMCAISFISAGSFVDCTGWGIPPLLPFGCASIIFGGGWNCNCCCWIIFGAGAFVWKMIFCGCWACTGCMGGGWCCNIFGGGTAVIHGYLESKGISVNFNCPQWNDLRIQELTPYSPVKCIAAMVADNRSSVVW